MTGRRPFVVLLTLVLIAPARATHAAEPPLLTVPVRIRIARCPSGAARGEPGKRVAVREASWIKAHVEAAERVLSPHRIALAVERDSFTPERCELLDRRGRDAMARHAPRQPWVVVLVTRRVRDLDLPSYDLMGVHWRYGGGNRRWRGRRWIFLTARARPPVLAHELAHYFGLRHDAAGGNLMTPGPSDPRWRRPGRKPKPFAARLSARQAARFRRAVDRFLRRARLRRRTGKRRRATGRVAAPGDP